MKCLDISTALVNELLKNQGTIAVLILILAFSSIALFVYTRANPNDRRAVLLFQDLMRNFAISALFFAITGPLLSLFCFTFSYLLPAGDDYEFLVTAGGESIKIMQLQIIRKIKYYRDQIITEFGPNSIVYRQISSFGSGIAFFPSRSAPKNIIFVENANMGIGALNAILATLSIQRFILELLVSSNAIFILLLLALIIRIIPGFTSVGDFMYSLFIGIFFLLPSLYSVFLYPFIDFSNPIASLYLDLCDELEGKLPSGFSFYFLTPITCEDLAFLQIYTLTSVFIPNLILGLVFSFISNFKKIFDVFSLGSE